MPLQKVSKSSRDTPRPWRSFHGDPWQVFSGHCPAVGILPGVLSLWGNGISSRVLVPLYTLCQLLPQTRDSGIILKSLRSITHLQWLPAPAHCPLDASQTPSKLVYACHQLGLCLFNSKNVTASPWLPRCLPTNSITRPNDLPRVPPLFKAPA